MRNYKLPKPDSKRPLNLTSYAALRHSSLQLAAMGPAASIFDSSSPLRPQWGGRGYQRQGLGIFEDSKGFSGCWPIRLDLLKGLALLPVSYSIILHIFIFVFAWVWPWSRQDTSHTESGLGNPCRVCSVPRVGGAIAQSCWNR